MAASRTPGEPEKEVTIAVTNLLSGENLRYLITKYPDIFIGYPTYETCSCDDGGNGLYRKDRFLWDFYEKVSAPRARSS